MPPRKRAVKKRKKDPAAVKLGRRGQAAWMASTTPEERSEAARQAAYARWAKQEDKE